MSNLREAAQQALEEIVDKYIGRERDHDRLDAIRAALSEPEPFQPDWANYLQGVKDGRAKTITITGTYQEFVEFVRMACLHETIYDDSEGRQILVLRMLDAYVMARSWALEHARHNFP